MIDEVISSFTFLCCVQCLQLIPGGDSKSRTEMPHRGGCTGKDVKSIASELGLKYVRITNPENKAWKNQDINKVYLLWPRCGLQLSSPRGPVDALLCRKGAIFPFKWKNVSKAAIRKHLDNTHNECVVCLEEVVLREQISCGQCASIICVLCLMKMCLTDDAIQRILTGIFMAKYRCVGCRADITLDNMRSLLPYYTIMHRLDELTEPQRDALMFIKENDPKYEHKMADWENYMIKYPLPHLEKGSVVQLQRLKNKPEWNGKEARIIGDGMMKTGIYRWPIQLTDDSGSKALMKQINLRKV